MSYPKYPATMRTAAAIGSSRHLTKSGIASAALFFTAYSTALPSTSLTTSSPVILLLQIATTSSASRWLSMRSSQVRLWRSATHHLLHHRAEGDLEKLDSSPKTKNLSRPPPQPQPLHFDDTTCQMRRCENNARSVTSHPCPRPQTRLNRLVSLARALLPSPGLKSGRTALSWWGKFERIGDV